MSEKMNRKAAPIAIVGVSALFPGARTVREFWQNIVHGRDCITDVPESHWRLEDYFDPDPSAPDKTYATRAGFVPRTDFNPIEFGLPPAQLDVTDILQLLSLTVARDVIADAGYAERPMPKERTGAIFGITGANSLTQPLSNRLQGPVWRKVLASRGYSDAQIDDLIETMKKAYAPWEENSFPGMLGNVVAGRVANRFDLGGTNCTIDAACASSLAAMRMAIDELQLGRADMMLTGGCDAENTILMFMCFSKTPAFSRKGAITPFDIEADGTLIGEGIGMMMLKRLEDAERDNDRIYAIIRGLGSSSDGRFKSIYAPRAEGQVRALRNAYAEAGVSPAQVGLIEAHGTGTAVGDATEVQGLTLAFEQTGTLATDKRTALGSVKSQIGHTKAAAGAASAIKAALSLYHRVLPPTINVSKPDPKLGLDATPLYLNTEARPWFPAGGGRRYAGVSSFGFGGTNFHLVLEEGPALPAAAARFDFAPRPLLVTAPDPAALAARCRDLTGMEGPEAWPFGEAAPADHARIAFAAQDDAERCALLEQAVAMLEKQPDAEQWRHPKGITFRRRAMEGKVAALFAGQGAQHPDMGRMAMNAVPEMRRFVEEMDPLFAAQDDAPLSQVMFPVPDFRAEAADLQAKAIRRTRYAQAAVGAMAAGQLAVLREAGFGFDMAGGHSFGELVALWAAGSMDDATFVRLAKIRGEAMTPPKISGFDSGTMTAVVADEETCNRLIAESGAEVQVCNINTPRQTVVGGGMFGISVFEKFLAEHSVAFTRLQVSGAFHTPRVAHAVMAFARAIDAETVVPPRLPVHANRDGQPYGSDVAGQMKAQLSEPVRFRDMIERMYADGARIFVEFGPKDALSRMVGRILGDRPHTVIALDNGNPAASARRLMEAAAELAAAGLRIADPIAGRPAVPAPVPARKGTIGLLGVNHVSEARRRAFEEALANPPALAEGTVAPAPAPETPAAEAPAVPAVPAESPAPMPVAEMPAPALPLSAANAPTGPAGLPAPAAMTASGLVGDLSQKLASAHHAFLEGQGEALRETLALENNPAALAAAEAIRSATVETHRRFIESVTALAASSTGPGPATLPAAPARTEPASLAVLSEPEIPAKTEAPAPEPVAVPEPETPAAPAALTDGAASLLLGIVAEKTGYPEDVLDLDMDMEADLGIDSIKRVEILGALREQNPEMAEPDPEVLGTLRTLRDVAVLAGGMAAEAPAAPAEPDVPAPAMTEAPAPEPVAAVAAPEPETPAAPAALTDGAASLLLGIVAEKTGYPEDVLDLDMDMEADLGIDSIKRVEILGALREQNPEMAEPDPEVLGTLRTLRDVAVLAGGMAAEAPAAPAEPDVPAPAMTEAPAPEPVAAVAAPEPETPAAPAALTDGAASLLLGIVAEKTGYPEDVLDLDMDMEADLGIDSIKRVEILGALREQNPEMAEPDPEVLGTLRTLRDVAVLAGGIAREAAALPGKSHSAAEEDTLAALDIDGIGRAEIRVVPAPAPLLREAGGTERVLIAGNAPFGEALAAELRRDGTEVRVEPALAAATELLAGGGWSGLVLLRMAPGEAGLPVRSDEEAARAAEEALMLAKAAKPVLSGAAAGRFLAVTRMDGAMGYGSGASDPMAGTVPGLLKTFAAECPDVFCRHADLDPALDPAAAAARLRDEFRDADRCLLEVGLSREERLTVDLVPSGAVAAEGMATDPGEVFLVTGGARGVTALCVRELARRAPRRLVLLGRSALAGRDPDWAAGIEGDGALKAAAAAHLKATGKATPKAIGSAVGAVTAAREIRALLADLEAAGSTVAYVAADLSDPAALASLAAHPAIAGASRLNIVHGAGALADAMIERKTVEELRRVFAPKLHGLAALLSCLPRERIGRLWLFSSVAGLFGNIGQVDYAMANETLNRVAAQWRQAGIDARSINWGAWDAGMVDDRIRAVFRERGIVLIPPQVGAALFADELARPAPATGVCMIGSLQPLSGRTVAPGLLHTLGTIRADWGPMLGSPAVRDHRIGGRAILPAAFALSAAAGGLERAAPGWTVTGAGAFSVLNGVAAEAGGPRYFDIVTGSARPDGETEDAVLLAVTVADESGRPRFRLDDLRMERTLPPAAEARPGPRPEAGQSAAIFYAEDVLFHGESLRMLARFGTDEAVERAVFELAPLARTAFPAGALTDPVLGDAMLQAALAATHRRSGLPSLPMRLDALRFQAARPRSGTVSLDAQLVEDGPYRASWAIEAVDGEGLLTAMTATVIKSASLAPRFASGTGVSA